MNVFFLYIKIDLIRLWSTVFCRKIEQSVIRMLYGFNFAWEIDFAVSAHSAAFDKGVANNC